MRFVRYSDVKDDVSADEARPAESDDSVGQVVRIAHRCLTGFGAGFVSE